MQKAATPLSIFSELAPADQERIRQVSTWRWAASKGEGLAPPLDHPTHQRWIETKGNAHSPAHREIMLGLHGKTVFGVAGKVYEKTPGTLFLFDHHESRDWLPAPHTRTHASAALWLHFFRPQNSLTFNTVLRDASGKTGRGITRRIHSSDLVARLMKAWDCYAATPCPLQWELLKSLVTSTVLEVLTAPLPKSPTSHQGHVVELIQQYIQTHVSENLSLGLLAQIAGYSPFFFHRLFQNHTGKTPKEAIDEARLEQACRLLKEGYTVSATAEGTGFSSPYSFSRFFKQKIGIPPRTWQSSLL